MPIPIFQYGNCTTDLLGSGSRSCDLGTFGDVVGINLHQKGFGFLVSEDLTEAVAKDAISSFNMIPYNGIYEFTQDTPDNETATSSRGIMATIRSAKPQFSFGYDSSACKHKSLYDKRGSNRWDVSLNFETGVLFALSGSGATQKVGGFDTGMFDVQTLRLLAGTDPQMSTVVMQFIDANQFNTKFVFITWAELGFSFLDLEGVIETSITLVESPEVGDSELIVRVGSACNADDVILGLDETDFLLGGTQTTPKTITAATYDANTGNYTLTLSSAFVDGDTIQPQLGDANGNVVEDDLGFFFKGKLASEYEITATT
jgi:hypothetical protein